MNGGRINLQNMKNTRDLGGISAADGRRVKARRLIRSGALFDAAPADLNVLFGEYGVRNVVDLRRPVERALEPDPALRGVAYHELSLLDDSFFGIARDEYSLRTWLGLFTDHSVDPDEVFCAMYRKLLFDDRVKPLYRRFFRILLQGDGAVLWHCSAGKDRAGVAALLVLSALGVPEDDAVADYMLTGVYTAREIEQTVAYARTQTDDPHMLKAVDTLMTVKESYVRQLFAIASERHGGMTAYLSAEGILDDGEREALRELYLKRGEIDEKR